MERSVDVNSFVMQMPVQSNSADCNQTSVNIVARWCPHAVRATATFSSTAVIRRCENTRRVRPLTQEETSLQVLLDSCAPTATVSNHAFASSCRLYHGCLLDCVN